MKATLHIPTEQYGFVEVEVEADSVEEAVSLYPKNGEGLSDKEFNAFIDNQLIGSDNHIEQYEKASADQKAIIQVIKRALKRIEYKNR